MANHPKRALILPGVREADPAALQAALRNTGGAPTLSIAGIQPQPVQAILPATIKTGNRFHPQLGAIVLIYLPDLVPIVLQAEAARKVAARLLEHADKADALAAQAKEAGPQATAAAGPVAIPAELLDLPDQQPTETPQKPVDEV